MHKTIVEMARAEWAREHSEPLDLTSREGGLFYKRIWRAAQAPDSVWRQRQRGQQRQWKLGAMARYKDHRRAGGPLPQWAFRTPKIVFRNYQSMAQRLRAGCSVCGEKDVAVLEFHHRDPSTKEGAVGRAAKQRGNRRFCMELDKCDALCSNCHQRQHDEAKRRALLVRAAASAETVEEFLRLLERDLREAGFGPADPPTTSPPPNSTTDSCPGT